MWVWRLTAIWTWLFRCPLVQQQHPQTHRRHSSPFTSAWHNLGPKTDGTHPHNCHPWLWTLNVSQLPKIGLISAWIAVTNVRVTLEECWISRLYIKMAPLTVQYETPFSKSTGYNLKTAAQIYSFLLLLGFCHLLLKWHIPRVAHCAHRWTSSSKPKHSVRLKHIYVYVNLNRHNPFLQHCILVLVETF